MREFIFDKKDLRVLLQETGDTISFKIIYEPLDPARKEFRAYIEATSVAVSDMTGATVRGCPNPPGCR
jgi:hypothetical protein